MSGNVAASAQEPLMDGSVRQDNAGRIPFGRRIALRTNVLEWVAVVPNFGLECRLNNNPFRYMTLGLTAKYNWSSFHGTNGESRYSPPFAYDLLDVRPEYRYYFRIKDGKNAKSWRAQYVGAYANYSDYAFKFGEYGLRGHDTFGLGLSLGYVLPLYEYRKGAIDVDLGFSVGVQFAKHEAFTHSMDGNYYTRLAEGDKYFSLKQSSSRILPYPVVSELRVAFVWRQESLRYDVKTDESKKEAKKQLERNLSLVMADLEGIMPMKYKYRFDSENKDDVRKWKQDESLYRNKFAQALKSQKEDMLKQVDSPSKAFPANMLKKLHKMVDKREKDIWREFDRLWADEKKRKK